MAKQENETKQPNASDKENILKLSDVSSKYPQQWVTVDITKRDDSGWPVEGKVILHSKHKDDIVDKTQSIDGKDLYLFYSGSIDDEVA